MIIAKLLKHLIGVILVNDNDNDNDNGYCY